MSTETFGYTINLGYVPRVCDHDGCQKAGVQHKPADKRYCTDHEPWHRLDDVFTTIGGVFLSEFVKGGAL